MNSETLQPPAAPAVQESPARSMRSAAGMASLLVSGALLAGLYYTLDLRLLGQAFRRADPLWLVISVAMIAPITVLRAVRFRMASPPGALSGVTEALHLTLLAAAFNVFVPAKAGDLIKSYFVTKRGGTTAGVGIAIIVYERLCDMVGLTGWCLLAWVVGRPLVGDFSQVIWPIVGLVFLVCAILVSSERAADLLSAAIARALPRKAQKVRDLAAGWRDLLQILHGRRVRVVLFSCLLWLVHLTQIWMFTVALGVRMPFAASASLSAVALLAGQMPFTVAGLGARDVALVMLVSGYMAPEDAAAMALLITTRTLLPPLAALPIMRPHLAALVEEARGWRARARG